MSLVIHAFGATNVGRLRELNEDNFLTGTTVFAVADGMGGHAAGEVASEAALGPLRNIDGNPFRDPQAATDALADAVSKANEVVLAQAAGDPDLRGMGTTLTTVMVRGSRLHLAHVGDSRAYLLREGMLELLTEDHTLVNQLVKEGRLTEEQAATHPQRSVITRAIGVEAGVHVDTMPEPLELAPGDQVLLCSDGLTGPVTESLIAEILMTETDGDVACKRLIDAANAGGGPDNITCVLLRVEGDGTVTPRSTATTTETSDDDATAELPYRGGDDEAVEEDGAPPVADEQEEPEPLDARRLAELAGGDSDIDDTPAALRGARRRRIAARLFGVLLVLVVLIGGSVLLLSRSYFVGVGDDGQVGIYRGIQGSVVGVPLATLVEEQSFAIDDVPERLQQGLQDGVPFPSLAEAQMHVEDVLLPATLEDELAPTPEPQATSEESSEPKDEPDLDASSTAEPSFSTTTPDPVAEPTPTPSPTAS